MTEKRDYLNLFSDKKKFQDEYLYGSQDYPLLGIGPIRKLNIFVGANNSRKTRFLRQLTKLFDVQLISAEASEARKQALIGIEKLLAIPRTNPNSILWQKLFELLDKQKDSYKEKFPDISFPQSVFLEKYIKETITNEFYSINTRSPQKEIKKSNSRLTTKLKTLKALKQRIKRESEVDKSELVHLTSIIKAYEIGLETDMLPKQGISRLFFPTLRSPVANLREDKPLFYINKELLELQEVEKKVTIHAGENLFNDVLEYRNSDRKNRKKFEAFQKFIGNQFFDGKEVEIVARPKENEEKILIHIENSERNLNDVGDGVQSIILLMLPVFMAEKDSWIFYDEPELSLHPGFQNLLIETILNNEELKSKNLKFFVTTHSNHFIEYAQRYPEEVSLFSFKYHDKEKTVISHVSQNFIEVLNELGCKNSSVLLANCSIWVEGVTDRKYLQTFLKLYCQDNNLPEFKEDLDYTFLEYAGSSLKHYLFEATEEENANEFINSFAINNKIWLLADEDRNKGKKHESLRKQAEKNDFFEYHTTGVLEIENLLPPKILKKFLTFKNYNLKENQQIIADNYAKIGLGKYFGEITESNTNFAAQSDTLTTYWKKELANFVETAAREGKVSWQDLLNGPTKNATNIESLTKSLHSFISKNCLKAEISADKNEKI
jgi:hypothetical protein